jgi:bacterioferritin (cytochrome b1)
MDKAKVIELLNQAISLEYQAYIQYFYQSLKLRGVSTMALKQFLVQEADIELGHSKTLATQVAYLGGTPAFKISDPIIGDTPQEMIRNNIKREEFAIKLYRQIMSLVEEDEQLYEIIRQILQDELGDVDEFKLLIE